MRAGLGSRLEGTTAGLGSIKIPSASAAFAGGCIQCSMYSHSAHTRTSQRPIQAQTHTHRGGQGNGAAAQGRSRWCQAAGACACRGARGKRERESTLCMGSCLRMRGVAWRGEVLDTSRIMRQDAGAKQSKCRACWAAHGATAIAHAFDMSLPIEAHVHNNSSLNGKRMHANS